MTVPELLATLNAGESSRVSPEELRRLYQSAGKLYAERQFIEESSLDDIDKDWFKEFYHRRYQGDPESADVPRLLENLRLAKDGKLSLAGALLFGRHNEVVLPDFFISVVWFWGNDFIADDYRTSFNVYGSLKKQFEDAFNFVRGTLKKVQGEKSFNSTGTPEVPDIVFKELLVNALIHRDYFISDSIKLFVFENRIEIKNPGNLPNNLTIEEIRQGIQRRSRNIVLASFANDVLPYRGIGSGILKSLQAYPAIDFEDNKKGEFFKVTIHRPEEKRRTPGGGA